MIRKKRHVYQAALAATLLTTLVVTMATLVLDPPETWVRELVIGNTLGVVLAFPITLLMGDMVLRNHRLSEELRLLLQRDRLTEVATRDHFFTRMADDAEAVGIVLMIDIDHFKQINDAHGHLVGDRTIEIVAGRIRNEVRAHDLVCRFGGEEFLVFLYATGSEEGVAIAERMRRSVAEAEIQVGALTLATTISVGAAVKTAGDEIESAILKADEALYRAKSAGRNRVSANLSGSSRRISRSVAPAS